MLRVIQQFLLTTHLVLFASQSQAMFIQSDWLNPTEPGVGTNRYAYSFNDPINLMDPTGNHAQLGGPDDGLRGEGTTGPLGARSATDIARQNGIDPGEDQTIDQAINASKDFSVGVKDAVEGIARCIGNCGEGYNTVATAISAYSEAPEAVQNEVEAFVKDKLVEAMQEHKAYIAGRYSVGAAIGAATAKVSKNFAAGAAAAVATNVAATLSSIGIASKEAKSQGLSLDIKGIQDIVSGQYQ